jgi:hypothetical protein
VTKIVIFTTPYNTLVLGPFLGGPKTDPNLAHFDKNYKLNNKDPNILLKMELKCKKYTKKGQFWAVRKKCLKPAISRGSEKHAKNSIFRGFLHK